MRHSSECLLQLLQNFIKQQNKVNQIHSLLITNGHLASNIKIPSHLKWKRTLLYNTLIRAHLNDGKNYKTIFLYTTMLVNQVLPNSHTFPSLIKAATLSLSSLGTPLHAQVVKRGVLLDPVIQTTLVVFYGEHNNIRDACKIFGEISRFCVIAYNTLLHAFARNGDMESAVSLFSSMPEKDVVSWTAVINGFGRNGCFSEAIRFFRKIMVDRDGINCFLELTEATYVSVLSSCSNLDGRIALDYGKQVHGYMIRNVVSSTDVMGSALVYLYGKMGYLRNAMNVFDQMECKKICIWNAMISALASNGREKEALEMFEQLNRERQCPDSMTFVAVLTACARGNFVRSGLELFRSMSSDFGVKPRMEHYGCIVDLLGRAGFLNEAANVIECMPLQADASVLGAFLGACKNHGAIESADKVGRLLLELGPRHSGQYVLLSSINARMERWDHARALRKQMVEAGILKLPAYSLVDLT